MSCTSGLSIPILPVVGGKKRPLPPPKPSDNDDIAASVIDTPAPVPAPALIDHAKAVAPSVKVERSKYCFYPDNYDQFDENALCAVSEAKPTKEPKVDGMMLFPSYIWPDGKVAPLRAQCPKLLAIGGVKKYVDNDKTKYSILASFGEKCMDDPELVKFIAFADKVRRGMARLAFNKGMVKYIFNSVDETIAKTNPIVSGFTTKPNKKNKDLPPITYPPAMYFGVSDAPSCKSRFFEKKPPAKDDPTQTSRCVMVSHEFLDKSCCCTVIVQFMWIFKDRRNELNVKAMVHEAVITPAESGDESDSTPEVTSVIDV